ncbi:hypothetical protein FRC08_010246, partial [Ceratobasidium sp. 394]
VDWRTDYEDLQSATSCLSNATGASMVDGYKALSEHVSFPKFESILKQKAKKRRL